MAETKKEKQNVETVGQGFKRVLGQKMMIGGAKPVFNIENLIATAAYGVAGFFSGRLIAKKTGKGRFLTVNKKSPSAAEEQIKTEESTEVGAEE